MLYKAWSNHLRNERIYEEEKLYFFGASSLLLFHLRVNYFWFGMFSTKKEAVEQRCPSNNFTRKQWRCLWLVIELSTNYKGILRDFLSFQLEGNIKGNIVDTLEVFFLDIIMTQKLVLITYADIKFRNNTSICIHVFVSNL